MTEQMDIIRITQWAHSGYFPKDFYEIFNVPYPTYPEISKPISTLHELFENYSWYLENISKDNTRNKTESYFKLLLEDIFGELSISVKLAGEGYIKYSLRGIRSALDLLFAGLFTVSSWSPEDIKNKDSINPFANAFFSGYWGKLTPLNLDDLVLSALESNVDRKSVKSSLHAVSEKFYPEIFSELGLDYTKTSKKEKKIKHFLENSLGIFFMNTIKYIDSDGWSTIKKEVFGNVEYFYLMLLSSDEFSLRACGNHEVELSESLKKKIGINENSSTESIQNIKSLMFTGPEFNDETVTGLCDYCDNKATIYALISRPDTRLMSNLIKVQLQKDELESINSCIIDSFALIGKHVTGYFGDIIYSEIYSRLNEYAHSNIVREPTISEWFDDFFLPTSTVLQCILARPLWGDTQN